MYCFKPPGRLQEAQIIFLTYAALKISQYFSPHALFWCSPRIAIFFFSFPEPTATQFFLYLGTGGGLLDNEMTISGKLSTYYLFSGSHSGFTDKFYYQTCTFKFLFTKTKKETIRFHMNPINREEKTLEAIGFL